MSKLKVGDKLVVTASRSMHKDLTVGSEFTVAKIYDDHFFINGGWAVKSTNEPYELLGLGVYLSKVKTKMTRTQLTEVAKVQAEAFAVMAKRLVALEKQVEELTAKPKLTGSDLTRQMLANGAESVECYVDDDSDKEAVDDTTISTITNIEDGMFYSAEGCPWRYAVPVDSIGEKK